jgi:hypothetical protein
VLPRSEPGSVLFIGDAAHVEFREPIEWLRARMAVRIAADPQQGLRCVRGEDRRPQLVVVAQPRPGCFSPPDIERLHRALPLARLVALLGSYCEGEVRSGTPWPGVLRVYWHEWLGRCEAELPGLLTGGPSTWALPRTATAVDQTLCAARRAWPQHAGLALIRSAKHDEFEGLADVCLNVGLSPVWLSPNHPPQLKRADLVIWDSDGRQPEEWTELKQWHERLHPAPILYLRGFPRHPDVCQAYRSGADRVLSKPFLLDDLVACIGAVLAGQETAASAAVPDRISPAA